VNLVLPVKINVTSEGRVKQWSSLIESLTPFELFTPELCFVIWCERSPYHGDVWWYV